jgi:hypothetical protein
MATDERQGIEREIEMLKAELEGTLDASQWELVRRLVSLSQEGLIARECDAGVVRVEEMARHFPAMAPAIRVVGEHLLEQQAPDVGKCCTSFS